MKARVSIIIISFNVKDLLKNCIESLKREAQEVPLEVIVVDNDSSDGTKEILEDMQGNSQQLKVILNTENRGFATANNQGASQSSGEYLLFLNPDTVVQPGLVASLAEYLDRHADVGIVGPQIVYPDGSLQLSCGKIPSLHCTILEAFQLWRVSRTFFGGYRYAAWEHDSLRKVGWVSGACLMIRRNLFGCIGGFDENFFLYAEDADLCLRAMKKGFHVIYFPYSTLIHYEGQSSRKVRDQSLLRGYQSKLYFFKKHAGNPHILILRLTFCVSSFVKSVVASIAARAFRNREYFLISKAHLSAMLRVLFLAVPKPPKNAG